LSLSKGILGFTKKGHTKIVLSLLICIDIDRIDDGTQSEERTSSEFSSKK